MFRPERDSEIICALATPSGSGGIAVVRVSGAGAASVVRKVCPFLSRELSTHTIHYGFLQWPDGREIDEVCVSYFQSGRSFTGEEVFEISCHGSPIIVRDALQALCESGARPAERGEFTYRAFMNGRIDLIQAESVLSLVHSGSKEAARIALEQLKGGLSKEVAEIQENLIWLLANVEADIDFSTEGLDTLDREKVYEKLSAAAGHCTRLLVSYRNGRVIQEGLRVALVGQPNVGKSSLLNCLVKEDRAIVTPIAGTTRDTVDAEMSLNGVKVILTDTAGLRESTDEVERIGVNRSYKAADGADIILYIYDQSVGLSVDDLLELGKLRNDPILVANKSDLISGPIQLWSEKILDLIEGQGLSPELQRQMERVKSLAQISSNSIEPDGEKAVRAILFDRAARTLAEDSAVITQARHFELLKRCSDSLERAEANLRSGLDNELMAIDLQSALSSVNELLGVQVDDQVINRIFKDFCIGK